MTDQKNMEVCGSVMDGVAEKGGVLESPTKKGATEYTVFPIRWLVLFVFVFNSASNSMQWIQYTIIQDAVVKYYGVSSIQVYWTSMIFMITYIPLIFPASWLLDKTVRKLLVLFTHNITPYILLGLGINYRIQLYYWRW